MNAMNIPKVLVKILVIVIIFLSPRFLVAQAYSISSGDAIRVTTTKYFQNSIVGNFINIKNDSLYFQINKRLFTIPLKQVTKLEVARGKKSNTKKDAIIGAIAGGLGLGGIAAISASGDQHGWIKITPGQAFLGGLLSGSLIGSLTGAIIGGGIKSTRWEEVPLQGLSMAKGRPAFAPIKRLSQAGAPGRRWRFSFILGTTSRGPAGDIEQAMRRDGWDKKEPIYTFTFGNAEIEGWKEHPYSKTGFGETGFSWCLQIAYRINRKFDGAILISHNPIGLTYGYRTDPELFLSINYYSTIISPMIIFKTHRILQLGFGPGVCINKIEPEDAGQVIYRQQSTRLCGVFQATLFFPQRTRFFLKLDAQYRLLPKTTYGPFKAGSGNAVRKLESFDADFSHLFVGAGIGIRI